MSVQVVKWYGIHKLQETMASLQLDLARLAADPSDLKPRRNLVRRVEMKMADVLAALQWFEYQNKLDVDPDRIEASCESFDASHLKLVRTIPSTTQTHMPGILVLTLSDDAEPETLPEASYGGQPDSVVGEVNGRG